MVEIAKNGGGSLITKTYYCDDADYQAARTAILELAKTSHRADDLGLVKERER